VSIDPSSKVSSKLVQNASVPSIAPRNARKTIGKDTGDSADNRKASNSIIYTLKALELEVILDP
jgi:hypothetical protein